MEPVIKVITKFLSKYNKEDIEGVLLYGSAVSGKMNYKSDIDIIVAVNMGEYECKVGCSVIDGIKVEYFIHNINNLYELALKQIRLNDPSRLTKFITSKIIYDKDGNFKKEIDKIKDLYNLPIKENHGNMTKKTIFHIKNRLDDIDSLIDSNSFYVSYYDVLNKIRELNTTINGYIIIPLTKTEELFNDKDYMKEYIKSDIHKVPNEIFMKKFVDCLNVQNKGEMVTKIKDLYDFVIKDEDFDSDNFELVFESDEIGI